MDYLDTIIQGESASVLKGIPDASLDLALTDPPYGVRYKDRNGRSIQNDDNLDAVLPVYAELYRALKPDSYCISFYGWNRSDEFLSCWKAAGFRAVGHIVWAKDYGSKAGYLKCCHEQAYLLVKGNPAKPAEPISDVQPWRWTGNRAHPTEKAVEILLPLVRAFSRPGDLVCDPFSGSGSTAVAAALSGRRYLGIELEEGYCVHARKRLEGVSRYLEQAPGLADA